MSLNREGYTLIELTVVMVLIGLTVAMVTPRFRDAVLSDNLRNSTNRLIGMIKTLRNGAIREQKVYIIHFDMESNRVWYDSPSMSDEERARAAEKAPTLREDVRIMDIWSSGAGKKMAGEAVIIINKKGYIQQSVIHLGSDDDREYTLLISPFLRRVKVFEKYVDIEDG
jgi:prepilin-type N-terminal cleavage/methylation domain-containing protein